MLSGSHALGGHLRQIHQDQVRGDQRCGVDGELLVGRHR